MARCAQAVQIATAACVPGKAAHMMRSLMAMANHGGADDWSGCRAGTSAAMPQGQPNHSVSPVSTDAAIDNDVVLIRSWLSVSPDVDRAAADRPRRAVVLRRRMQALQAGIFNNSFIIQSSI